MIRAFVLLLLSCIAPLAHAQATLTGELDRVDLWPHVRVLSDPARTMSVEAALASGARFAAPRGAYATLGMDKEVVWLRIPVAVSGGGEGLWVLDIDYALLQRIDVYSVTAGKVVHTALGNRLPLATRPLPGRSHAMPLQFSANLPSELLLRVDTPGAKIVPISLSRLPAFHARSLGEQLLQGAAACLGLVLLLFSLVQWLSLRESLYLKYALLVACSTLFSVHFFGVGEMYLWADRQWPDQHMAGVTALLAATATALFIEDALGGDLHRRLRVALNVVAAINAAAAVAYAANLIDIQAVAVFMNTTGLAPALIGLPGAIAKARKGDSIGAWFIAAWAGYFIASAILVGVVRGSIGVSFWTLHSFQIGATFDMLVFLRIASLRTAARHSAAQRAVRERDTFHSLAHTDPLTGLLNRRGLDDALAAALAAASPERILAIYVLDLDGFKPVNDQFGHAMGDELLRVVAQRLRGSVRAGDGVARLGGDEFVVMAEGLHNETQARDLGNKLLEAFASPFSFSYLDYRLGATIGYALAPMQARDAGALLKAADAAMYAGKQAGKFRVVPA